MRYIGSKRLLLPYIKDVLDSHTTGAEETFLDLFAGTNSVGLFFKPNYTIYSNDILYFSYVNAKALIENNRLLSFSRLREEGVYHPIEYLMELTSPLEGYYERSYSPTGEAMYLSVSNAKKVDAIRECLEGWRIGGLIGEYEYFYLLNALIEAIPFVSNITGTYGAFLKHWDKRAYDELKLRTPLVFDNGRRNVAFNEDANELVRRVHADITYIDTPYNARQYAPNYHVLENIARHKRPILAGRTKMFDWKMLRSRYSTSKDALRSMDDLLRDLQSTHVLLSYNNEGLISEADLYDVIRKHARLGCVEVHRIPYRKYQSKKKSENMELYELLFYFQKKKPTYRLHEPSVAYEVQPSLNLISQSQLVKSPLNYVGGKYRLLKQIIPLFPTQINVFVDLFSGGANVGINVPARKHIFNDMNYRINEMFRYFQSCNPVQLIQQIEKRISEYDLSKTNEVSFMRFREAYNKAPNPLDLYVLASYSYNYQFRFNNQMQFNNPFGRNRSSFNVSMKNNLLCFLSKLQGMNAQFTDFFFHEFDISGLSEGDFVYLDPPYLITTASYNDGNRGFLNWGETQEKQMYQLMLKLHEQKVKFALSNVLEHKGKENFLLKKFARQHGFMVHKLDYHYRNASYNTNKGDSVEVLITNY
ncbi:Dam family site-specific DNA-(adenine-N6)-methyltransferase [Pelistega europaea]|uniref:Site-specific DNA-methyltransferase (adenine-specific) n=1 Tax=Pelistega europaea TaxID=106147 RepID=A0A7Y4LBA1_9BURK|nr:Dam family site-specific DNA-(adenine-N6)-methyltransferase [Pelistega europaea]NOL50373.1 Dam family site-specific DNA-(adenine-N6)-methyltransferase [Pelistega europaea]